MERTTKMVTRQKLELEINKPMRIELLYNEPVIGQSQYGNYYLYAVKNENIEFSFFAPEPVHEELRNLKAGDSAVITKLAAQRGNKLITKYVVEHTKRNEASIIENPIQSATSYSNFEEDHDTTTDDGLYQKMLNSYKDAMRIQEEVGLVDISSVVRLAITLFIQRSK